MILGGDEIGRTQDGNNNAYCQDNETSWYDWERMDWGTVSFVQRTLALRQENPHLRQHELPSVDGAPPIVWFTPGGTELTVDTREHHHRSLALLIDDPEGVATNRFYLMLNSGAEAVAFRLPPGEWELALASGDSTMEGVVASVQDYSMALARGRK